MRHKDPFLDRYFRLSIYTKGKAFGVLIKRYTVGIVNHPRNDRETYYNVYINSCPKYKFSGLISL